MEEHVDQESSGGEVIEQPAPAPIMTDRAALLRVSEGEPKLRYQGCSRGCSRAVHCGLTLPFLLIVGLVVFSVATFYANQDRVGGCVLFGVIEPDEGILRRGPSAVCLTVMGVEMALCAFAVLFAIVLVIKAFRHSRMFTPFVFLELFLLILIVLVSIGISITMNIGINNTCASMDPAKAAPDFTKCGDINVNTDRQKPEDKRYPVWGTLLQESLVASWVCTLIYLSLVLIWIVISLFTCCAIQTRKNREGRARARRRINVSEGTPIVQDPNVGYGAT